MPTSNGALGMNTMKDRDEEVRGLIARQAADWFLAQREGNLGRASARPLTSGCWHRPCTSMSILE